MGKDKGPVTPAVRVLRENKVEFTEHIYKYRIVEGQIYRTQILSENSIFCDL